MSDQKDTTESQKTLAIECALVENGATSNVSCDEVQAGHGGNIKEEELRANDVLCGRGGKINAHEGNIQFREIVQKYKEEYLSKSTKKKEKAIIAGKIVSEVRNLGGRFLKLDTDTGLWTEIGDEKARMKSGQVLREDCAEVKKLKKEKERQAQAEGMMQTMMMQLPYVQPAMFLLPGNAVHPSLGYHVPPQTDKHQPSFSGSFQTAPQLIQNAPAGYYPPYPYGVYPLGPNQVQGPTHGIGLAPAILNSASPKECLTSVNNDETRSNLSETKQQGLTLTDDVEEIKENNVDVKNLFALSNSQCNNKEDFSLDSGHSNANEDSKSYDNCSCASMSLDSDVVQTLASVADMSSSGGTIISAISSKEDLYSKRTSTHRRNTSSLRRRDRKTSASEYLNTNREATIEELKSWAKAQSGEVTKAGDGRDEKYRTSSESLLDVPNAQGTNKKTVHYAPHSTVHVKEENLPSPPRVPLMASSHPSITYHKVSNAASSLSHVQTNDPESLHHKEKLSNWNDQMLHEKKWKVFKNDVLNKAIEALENDPENASERSIAEHMQRIITNNTFPHIKYADGNLPRVSEESEVLQPPKHSTISMRQRSANTTTTGMSALTTSDGLNSRQSINFEEHDYMSINDESIQAMLNADDWSNNDNSKKLNQTHEENSRVSNRRVPSSTNESTQRYQYNAASVNSQDSICRNSMHMGTMNGSFNVEDMTLESDDSFIKAINAMQGVGKNSIICRKTNSHRSLMSDISSEMMSVSIDNNPPAYTRT